MIAKEEDERTKILKDSEYLHSQTGSWALFSQFWHIFFYLSAILERP